MLKILKAFVKIYGEVRRIREILEIVHRVELERGEHIKRYSKKPLPPAWAEITYRPPKRDEYGEIDKLLAEVDEEAIEEALKDYKEEEEVDS